MLAVNFMSGVKLLRVEDQRPDTQRTSLRAIGTTLIWPADFRAAMAALCRRRGLPAGIPATVKIAIVEAQGILLMWPCRAGDPDGFSVRVSPAGRRVSLKLTDAFSVLKVGLPAGVTIGVPVSPFRSPRHGRCLALHFNQAEFLYKQSRSSAIGLLPDRTDA
ncbi:MAG TPA: hypothetical protein VGK74_20680 [Symbiobacteriaceae bacterium]|jgi:hypothetical protein